MPSGATAAAPASPATASVSQAAAPAAPATPATPATPARPAATPAVELGATIERLHDVLHLSRGRGSAHAHLELHPRDLGAVDVRLRATQDGVVATIKVHEQAALSAVQSAGQELRDSLQGRGITVARLDVSLAGGEHRGSGESRGETRGSRRGTVVLDAIEDDAVTETTTHVASALVDVHA